MAWDPALEIAFHPRVVAMVGISTDAVRGEPWGPRGSAFVGSYEQLGFKGRIYPVHPTAPEIMGMKAYPSVSAVPGPIDLVVVSVPARALPGVLEDCVRANAKNVHVFTSGFEETGEPEGRELGQRVREIAVRGGLRMIGPNCMGFYVPDGGIGGWYRLSRKKGPVCLISQSGGHCNWLAHYGPDYGIYFSKVISFGNGYLLESTDFLEYAAKDPETRLICLYLEGVRDGRRLLRLVREVNRTKPVIVWKGGLTESGSRAAASHTGSLAGQEAVWRAFFAQTGAVPVQSLEEMAEVAMTFLCVPPLRGPRVAVLGLGGGTSVSSADTCSREGLEVPVLTARTQDELKKFISLAGASIKNPLDTGLAFHDVSALEREMEVVAADSLIDALIVIPHLDMVGARGADRVDRLVRYLGDFNKSNRHGKPAVVVFHSFLNHPAEAELRARLQVELPNRGIAVYRSLAGASRALARFCAYHRFQQAFADNS